MSAAPARRAQAAVLAMLLLAVVLLMPGVRAAQEPAANAAAVDAEVHALLDGIVASGCRFYRNGRWYGAPAARGHLLGKYAQLVAAGGVRSAEDFIERAATRSSLSGRDYAVQCAGAAQSGSGDWFRRQLLRLRDHNAPGTPGAGRGVPGDPALR